MRDRAEPLRLGIVGCGGVARRRHLPALRRVSEIEVAALADTDRARCDRLADDFCVARRYASVHELIDSTDVDAVAVLTPASAHAEVALTALDAGKSVFVEKPLALSLDAAEALVRRAEHSSATVMVGFNLRWHRLVRQARALAQEGAIGRIAAVATAFTDPRLIRSDLPEWRRRRDLGGGAAIEKLVHHFDLWRFLLGDEVDEMIAFTRSGETDDEVAAATGRMRGGALAQALASDRTATSNVVALYGEEGAIRIDLYRFDGLEHSALHDLSGAPHKRARRLVGTVAQLAGSFGEIRRGGPYEATYAAEWRHFAEAARAGRRSGSTFEDGRRALQITLATAESAALGRPVKVADAPESVSAVEAT